MRESIKSEGMTFGVPKHAIIWSLMDGQVRAAQRDEGYKQKCIERGLMNPTPSIERFYEKHKDVLGRLGKPNNGQKGTFFGDTIAIASNGVIKPGSISEFGKTMYYSYDFSKDEILGMTTMFEELDSMQNDPEILKIVENATEYKRSIEEIWRSTDKTILKHIYKILGFVPKIQGKVNVNVLSPIRNIDQSYRTDDSVNVFFSKAGAKQDTREILGAVAHQYVHSSLLPTPTDKGWTKDQKEHYHAFIKFLTNKEVYHELSKVMPGIESDRVSYLELVTTNEKPEVMADVYPFFIGYRYRNVDKEGLNPEVEVRKAITRDREYYEDLVAASKRVDKDGKLTKQAKRAAKKLEYFKGYDFENLDAKKIATYFRARKGMRPEDFGRIDYKTEKAKLTRYQALEEREN